MRLHLDATDETVVIVLADAGALVKTITTYNDHTSTTYAPGQQEAVSNGTTEAVIVPAPSASTQRQLTGIKISNADTVTETFTVRFKKTAGSITQDLFRASLLPGEHAEWLPDVGWAVYESNGNRKTTPTAYTGRPLWFRKTGTATEAAFVRYCFAKDAGSPGAWAPGTPGLNGRATDGTTAADAGCLPLWTPSAGLYLVGGSGSMSVAGGIEVIDILWINSGLVVTTTTAQAIGAPVSLPARDANGSSNGEGVMAAILVTTATTNAAAVTNTTLSYTDQDGNAGNTATIPSFPATAVIGSFVPFNLAAGDDGIRSVQSVTLGTSYAAGAISLVLYRPIAKIACPAANQVYDCRLADPLQRGLRLWTGSCLIGIQEPTATTATTVDATFYVVDR